MAVGAAVAITALAACHGWSVARREGVADYAAQDQRYARAVSYADTLSPNAVLVSVVYSGTLHFYTGRDVLRWDVMAKSDLDMALSYLRARGHPVYFIGDLLEVDEFRRRFAGTRTVETLDRRGVTPDEGFVVIDLTTPEGIAVS